MNRVIARVAHENIRPPAAHDVIIAAQGQNNGCPIRVADDAIGKIRGANGTEGPKRVLVAPGIGRRAGRQVHINAAVAAVAQVIKQVEFTPSAGKRVISRPARDDVIVAAAGDSVVTVAAEHIVVSPLAIDVIIAGAALNKIIAVPAFKQVVARTSENHVAEKVPEPGHAQLAVLRCQQAFRGRLIPAADIVVPVTPPDRVVARAAVDRHVVPTVAVVIGARVDPVVARPAQDNVAAGVTLDRLLQGAIVAGAAINEIVARPAKSHIVPIAKPDLVIAGNLIVVGIQTVAKHHVITVARLDHVVARAAAEPIVAGTGHYGVITLPAVDGLFL